MPDKRMAELLLTASLQMRSGMEQTVSVLRETAKRMPEFTSVAENYISIDNELKKAIETLKGMI